MPAAQSIQDSKAMGDSAAFLKQVEDLKSSQLNVGDLWFIIDVHWYKKMVDYLQGNCDHPGPIDNSGLMDADNASVSGTLLRENLQDELDYVVLPERGWNLVHEKFGLCNGQTPISRKVIDSGTYVRHKMVEVYPLDLSLELYPDFKPQIVIISRMATLDDLKKEARKKFQLGSAQIRFYQKFDSNYELIDDSNGGATLQDLSFGKRQSLIVDVEKNGKWMITSPERAETAAGPSAGSTSPKGRSSGSVLSEPPSGLFGLGQRETRSLTAAGNHPNVTPGLCGLTNLGNTCFMNSALQCMVNVSPLTDYFISGKYTEEINETNPLGMHGEIAQSFGELCKQMWSGRCTTVVPRPFKLTVGRFAPQFSGYQQQDSQELMAFLLDGLHEDLNRVRQKPYVEVKDADGQLDELVAAESWNNYKKRNDSVIVDLFHGLLKSTVVCPECDKISVTFDPFCYLSLPLPAKKERQMTITYVSLDPEKPILKCKVTVPKGGTAKDLTDAVARLFGGNSNQLVVVDVYGSRLYKIFDNQTMLTSIMDRDETVVYEVEDVPQSQQPVLVVFYNRLEKKGITYAGFQKPPATLAGLPMVAVLPKDRLTLKELTSVAEKRFSRFMNLPSAGEVWWRSDNGSDSGLEENGETSPPDQEINMEIDDGDQNRENAAPQFYGMRVVNSTGTTNFEEIKATGIPVSADQNSNEVYVSLDWHPLAGQYLDSDYHKYVEEHDSMADIKLVKKSISLNDCLDLFTTTEKLGQDDLWYCPRCKKHQQATKKFDLWNLPEVLIIHLKRFSYTRYSRDKIEGLVDFPLHGLDVSKWVINPKHQSCFYDLVAVSNHYGGLGGGHYTAYAKNKITGKWYNFDDSSVSQIGEEDVITKNGYVLVYIRRHGAAVIDPRIDPNVEMESDESGGNA